MRARRRVAEAREASLRAARMGLRAMMAARLEQEAEAVVDRMLDIIRTGTDADAIRAAEAIMSRVYGRPVQPTEDLTPRVPSTAEEVRAMTPEERRRLLAAALATGDGSLVPDTVPELLALGEAE